METMIHAEEIQWFASWFGIYLLYSHYYNCMKFESQCASQLAKSITFCERGTITVPSQVRGKKKRCMNYHVGLVMCRYLSKLGM